MAVCPNDLGAAGDGATPDDVAVKAAVATGEDVYLKPSCRYLVNNTTIQPSNGQRFYGGGALLKTAYAWDAPSEGPRDSPKFFRIMGKSGVRIDGIAMEWSGTARVYGVTMENATDCAVEGCRFPGTITAIYVWKGSKGTILNGNRTYGGVFGIATGGDGAGNTDGPITNTTITGNHLTGAVSEGIDINWDTVYATISGNQLRGNNLVDGEDEIDIGGGACRDIIVTGNIVDGGGNASTGVNIKLSSKNIKVADNTLRNFKTDVGSGVVIQYGAWDSEVVNNTIYGCYRGVHVRSVSGAPSGILLAANTISYYSTQGIYLQGAADAPLVDITVLANRLDGANVGLDGMLAENVGGLIAQANRAKRNQKGFRFGSAVSGVVSGNNLTDNSTSALTGQSNFSSGSIVLNNVA